MQGVVFESPRLRLQPHAPGDWEAMHRLACDPEVMRYITGGIPFTTTQSRAFVERQAGHLARHGFCRWKIELRATGEYVGFCGGEYKTLAGEEVPEIGWWIAREHWGKGIASEASRIAFCHLWEERRIPRLTSCAFPENRPSIRIMEKLGLAYEKDFVEFSPVAGAPFRLVMYSITRSAPTLAGLS